ncbi:MAG: ATP-binding cassette domain-containing protein, partial [Pirellulaceae bacterium]
MSQTTSTPQPIIEIRHVFKRFGGVTALDDVSLTVRPGELLAICGENGAGKSTLMKILCGQHTDYSGEIVLRGAPIRFRDIKDAEGHGVSIIHQELNLVEELSVAANIFLGRELVQGLFLNNREMNRRAREILSKFECDIDPQTPAGKLRIGDQQLIEIAKALSIGSEILIMDEPTSALTEAESARLDRVISQLRKSGVTILYISHKMEEIFRLSDRIA